ncbi:MAG: HAMP domain-containing protein [Alphaproteobacteria bacterium]|nr:HAMP domain-containing protein [Alphaproteobacteria bacterium]
MSGGRLRLPDTILSRTLLVAVGTALLLTLLNLGALFLRPPPRDMPLSAYELSRLLRGERIVKTTGGIAVATAAAPPAADAQTTADRTATLALAHQLGLPPGDVRLHREEMHRSRFPRPADQDRRELAAYGLDHFNPVVFGAFTAAAKLPDGRWRIVARRGQDRLQSWQTGTVATTLLSVLIVALLAWLFSSRLARPIRAFGLAAEKVGRRQQLTPVAVSGPAEIRLAAEAVNDMQRRIAGYVAERTALVGAIAHDLRTPLTRLAFLLASAPEDLRGKAEAQIAEMEQMIAATLDFVADETRARPHEPVDLALLVEGVVDDLADTGRDVTLAGAAPATVSGDPILLKRLFANLITNAVTYGERAKVTVSTVAGWATVEVADAGPGLAEADLERAFEPFYRAESSRNRATGGIGLGLAIVRAAAARHGGEATLRNRREGGLSACVRLPTV